METTSVWPWLALAGLGAFHGLNPGMGWLFAVALGMQERRGAAVWRALGPLALGHLLAVGLAIFVAWAVGIAASPETVRYPVAAMLVGVGVWRIFRHCHARGIGMRAGMGGLTWWSFLMATAHGAGLMVLPVVLGMPAQAASGPACHSHAASTSAAMALAATTIHGAGYLLVTAAIAWVVFERVGVGILRRAWFNIDLLWAATLVVTGVLTVVTA